ncbi:MAG: ATP-dependent DNA helicase [Ruminococcaceae bacterium]|nr:ATP-dependent DNA helicase [Oscillospiraceae bacterium]
MLVKYNADTLAMELSVHELCTMAHKSGHLDARRPHRSAAPVKSRELHRKLQAGEGAFYQADVLLVNTVIYRGVTYTVTGVADGVIEQNGTVTVEEIKISRGASAGEDAYSRLRCYAHFLAEARHLARVRLRMRVCDRQGEGVRDSYSEMSAADLRDFYCGLLDRIEPHARFELLRRTELISTVTDISFPYPSPREGQTELAESTFRAIRKGERLFAEAPTGIGKTMSTLYPAVKSVGEGLCDRIFYLTAKASTRREAYAAAGKLFEKGAKLRTVMLYAKEQMCLCEAGCRRGSVSNCDPDACPYARGYYDRVDGAMFELLSRQNGFPRHILLEVARKHRVCPYELSLDLSRYCEIIICDYNYAFDPAVYLRRYFDAEEGERGKYVFLVDEAHNLPDRARSMYSATLSAPRFEELYARLDAIEDREPEEIMGGFLLAFRRLASLCTEQRVKHEDGSESGYYINRAPLRDFIDRADLTRRRLDSFLKSHPLHRYESELGELSSMLRRFCGIGEYYDEHFLTYVELKCGELSVQLFCLDPSGVLNTCSARAVAAVFFSATLTPLDYFAEILGGDRRSRTVTLTSPYDPENLGVTVVTSVSTRMESRAVSYRRIATLIAATVSAKAGNYLVYFPSYDYLESVLERFRERYPRVKCIVQERHMTQVQREAFLDRFKEDEGHLRVGFCVLGGSFSEGVDLPGNRLIGVVVVGVGIPGLSNERNILRDYYENKCERGYDYAYTFPGMNRVLQAAGRVIRREEDRGIVVLIDDRYGEEPYLHLYPSHWQNICVAGDAKSLARRMQLFWQGGAPQLKKD